MRVFVYAVLVCFIPFSITAQVRSNAKIIGKVVDAITLKPVEYATITLKDAKAKALNGAVADAKGVFTMSGVPEGKYIMTVEFIGYTTYLDDTIRVTDARGTINLNTLRLSPANQTLAAVTVNSKAPIVENKIDKIVYNAANDITSQGGVALDVLKKVPQVSVDIDGNVELQGNSNIRFLINGKPSSVFGNNLADALASIPASQIKSIEAITSPGAKYDAQGTGGIINIILKDSKVQGINGSINLAAGTRLENGSFNLNLRHNNFGVNAYFSGNAQLSSHTPNAYRRQTNDTAGKKSIQLLQDGYADFERNGYQGGLGFDWAINKKENFSGSFGYSHFNNHSNGITGQEQVIQDISGAVLSDVFSTRNADSRSGTHSFDWSLDYKKKYKKDGQELDILYTASYGVPQTHYSQAQTYKGQALPYTGSYSDNPGTDRETNISMDYAYPVTDEFMLETGVKTVIQNIHATAEVFTLNPLNGKYAIDPAQTYQINYNRNIYAGYISTSFALGKILNVKSGVRVEHTDTRIDFPGTSIPSYNSFVPSIIFSHKFDKGQTLKLSYSHRIERPDYREINPFLNLADPYNISTGNPTLQPELGDNFELGYNKSFDNGGSIYLALVSRFNSHDIKPYTVFYPTYKIGDSLYSNVSVSTRVNIGLENRTGISISGSLPVSKNCSLRTNIFISNRHIINNLNTNSVTNGLDGRINMNGTYQLPHNLVLEGFVNYNTSVNNVQGKQPQFFAYTFAFRKFFLNKKASFGFTATNPFSQYIRQETTVLAAYSSSYNLRQVPYRSFGISLTYKFGKLEFKKAKEEDNGYMNNPPGGNN